jgi:predicted dehydrogenase
MDPQEERLRAGKFPAGKDWGADWGEEPEEQWGTLSIAGEASRRVKTERGDYRGFYANIRNAMEKGVALDVTPEQALRTMRAIVLAHNSSTTGRRVGWGETAE